MIIIIFFLKVLMTYGMVPFAESLNIQICMEVGGLLERGKKMLACRFINLSNL